MYQKIPIIIMLITFIASFDSKRSLFDWGMIRFRTYNVVVFIIRLRLLDRSSQFTALNIFTTEVRVQIIGIAVSSSVVAVSKVASVSILSNNLSIAFVILSVSILVTWNCFLIVTHILEPIRILSPDFARDPWMNSSIYVEWLSVHVVSYSFFSISRASIRQRWFSSTAFVDIRPASTVLVFIVWTSMPNHSFHVMTIDPVVFSSVSLLKVNSTT